MIEHHLDIPTADGAMNTFVVHPDEGGPHPVVLFYMDAPGKREELHDMARRLASVGYFVVLPNLYYRRSRDYALKERTEAMAPMFEHMRRSTRTPPNATLARCWSLWTRSPAADASRIGAVGYCMSGPFVMWAAAAFPERFACIASIHGAGMATDAPDSPHRIAARLRCASYFACAEIDKWAPPADIAKLQTALEAAKLPHRVEWYPKVEHGFVFPQRAVYDRASSERHYERLFELFGRCLGKVAWPGVIG